MAIEGSAAEDPGLSEGASVDTTGWRKGTAAAMLLGPAGGPLGLQLGWQGEQVAGGL